MTRTGKYIYGIINSHSHESVGPYGMTVCKKVYFVPYQGIAAVVSDQEIIDYRDMLKDVLARRLIEHQKVIEEIMGLGWTVIPMKLGTFVQDETEVKYILNKGYHLIKEIICKINDKVEIDLAAVWSDWTAAIKEAGQIKEIIGFKEQLLKQSKGVTVDDQMKIGFMLKKALDEKREKYAFKIQDILKSVSIDYKEHELMDDKMVVNLALLIVKDKREDFDKKVEELNAEFNEKLNFRCVGPLPAYSFYTLEVKKLESEEIDWAKKRLGIVDGITSRDELKRVFRSQASSIHPDKNPDNPCAEKEFDEVNRAYKIISDYCAALEQTNTPLREDSLRGQLFEGNTILVRVRP